MRPSASRRAVLEFEKSDDAALVLDYFVKNGYMRVIYQEIYGEIPLTVDESHNILIRDGNLRKILPLSPSRSIYCRKCGLPLASYNPFVGRKPWRRETCPKCHVTVSLKECRDDDDWVLTDIQIGSLLDEFVSVDLLARSFMGFCINCSVHKDLEIMGFNEINSGTEERLKDYVRNLYCDTCCEPLNIFKAYRIGRAGDFFGRNGYWLEWYVKNLIRRFDPDIRLEQGLYIHNDEVGLEADILMLQSGEITVLECRAFKPSKRVDYGEVADVVRLHNVADRVFLVTSANIKERTRRLLSRQSVQVIERLDIEVIGRSIASRVRMLGNLLKAL